MFTPLRMLEHSITKSACFFSRQDFRSCLKDCRINGTFPGALRKVQENYQMNMICRTESEIVFQIDWVQHSRGTEPAPNATYIIRVDAVKDDNKETALYLVRY